MAQRISRAKRTDRGAADRRRRATSRSVLKVLYLMFNEGYGGEVDLAAEAIRLTRHPGAGQCRARRAPGCSH